MNRAVLARRHLTQLVNAFEILEAERQRLLQAAARIAEIQTEKQAIIADAQAALDRLNAVEGTSFTLQQIREQFGMLPPADPNP